MSYTLQSESCDYYGASGDTLNVATRDEYGENDSTFKIKLIFNQGDANFSGSIDVSDLQEILNRIRGLNKKTPFNFTASDLYTDERITVQDVVKEVDLLLLQPAPESARARVPLYAGSEKVAMAEVSCDGDKIGIRSDVPVAAFSIYLENAVDFRLSSELVARGFVCATKGDGHGLRAIVYSPAGAVLEQNMSVGNVVGRSPVLIEAELADSEARTVPASVVNDSAAVTDVIQATDINTELCPDGLKVTCAGESKLFWSVAAIDGRVLSSDTLDMTGTDSAIIPMNYDGICIVTIRGNHNIITKKINLCK